MTNNKIHEAISVGAIILGIIASISAYSQHYHIIALKDKIATLQDDIKGNTAISISNTKTVRELQYTVEFNQIYISQDIENLHANMAIMRKDKEEDFCVSSGWIAPWYCDELPLGQPYPDWCSN